LFEQLVTDLCEIIRKQTNELVLTNCCATLKLLIGFESDKQTRVSAIFSELVADLVAATNKLTLRDIDLDAKESRDVVLTGIALFQRLNAITRTHPIVGATRVFEVVTKLFANSLFHPEQRGRREEEEEEGTNTSAGAAVVLSKQVEKLSRAAVGLLFHILLWEFQKIDAVHVSLLESQQTVTVKQHRDQLINILLTLLPSQQLSRKRKRLSPASLTAFLLLCDLFVLFSRGLTSVPGLAELSYVPPVRVKEAVKEFLVVSLEPAAPTLETENDDNEGVDDEESDEADLEQDLAATENSLPSTKEEQRELVLRALARPVAFDCISSEFAPSLIIHFVRWGKRADEVIKVMLAEMRKSDAGLEHRWISSALQLKYEQYLAELNNENEEKTQTVLTEFKELTHRLVLTYGSGFAQKSALHQSLVNIVKSGISYFLMGEDQLAHLKFLNEGVSKFAARLTPEEAQRERLKCETETQKRGWEFNQENEEHTQYFAFLKLLHRVETGEEAPKSINAGKKEKTTQKRKKKESKKEQKKTKSKPSRKSPRKKQKKAQYEEEQSDEIEEYSEEEKTKKPISKKKRKNAPEEIEDSQSETEGVFLANSQPIRGDSEDEDL
jgi:hypothetical protein